MPTPHCRQLFLCSNSKEQTAEPALTQLLSDRIDLSMQIVLFLHTWPEQLSTLPPRERRVLNN